MKASYAVKESVGRVHSEAAKETDRTPWQRDRDRIIHSAGFRALQYKTQVFLNHEGDFFRTRLTHSLEVAQIARSIARSLQLDEDLTEALALAHDLGHTPFGHAGEYGLAEKMKDWGGFDHNLQSIRQITELEHRSVGFDGLNLTFETLNGLAKRHGEVEGGDWAGSEETFAAIDGRFPCLEAQIAAACDDLAYHGHDLDDGLRAGILNFDEVLELPLIKKCAQLKQKKLDWNNRDPEYRRRLHQEVIRSFIDYMVKDLKQRILDKIKEHKIVTEADVRHAPEWIAFFTPETHKGNEEVRDYLMKNFYRHWQVNRMTRKGKKAVGDMFDIFESNTGLLTTEWQELLAKRLKTSKDPQRTKVKLIADCISSMTDRMAILEYRRLTDLEEIA